MGPLDLPRFCGQSKKPQNWDRRIEVGRRRRFSKEFKFDAVSMVVDQGWGMGCEVLASPTIWMGELSTVDC